MMKLENYNQVVNAVQLIKKHEETLEKLNSPTITIKVDYSTNIGHIMTIGAWKGCEHDFTEYAQEFIEKMKKNLEERIEIQKQALEKM